MSICKNDIAPGLVIHVTPQNLINQGGCSTIALKDHVLRGDHYFLVVERDAETGICLCMPLHSDSVRKNVNDWIALDNREKSGKAENWRDNQSFYFKWAYWKVPASSFKSASSRDNSEGDRRWYGVDNPKALAAVKSHLSRARNPWRDL